MPAFVYLIVKLRVQKHHYSLLTFINQKQSILKLQK